MNKNVLAPRVIIPSGWNTPEEAWRDLAVLGPAGAVGPLEENWDRIPMRIRLAILGDSAAKNHSHPGHPEWFEHLRYDKSSLGDRMHKLEARLVAYTKHILGEQRIVLKTRQEYASYVFRNPEIFDNTDWEKELGEPSSLITGHTATGLKPWHTAMAEEWPVEKTVASTAADQPLSWWKRVFSHGPPYSQQVLLHPHAPLAEIITGRTGPEAQDCWQNPKWWEDFLDAEFAADRQGVGHILNRGTFETLLRAPGMSEAGIQAARTSRWGAKSPNCWARGHIDWASIRALMKDGINGRDEAYWMFHGLTERREALPVDVVEHLVENGDVTLLTQIARRKDLSDDVTLKIARNGNGTLIKTLIWDGRPGPQTIAEIASSQEQILDVAARMGPWWSQNAPRMVETLLGCHEAEAHHLERFLYWGGLSVDLGDLARVAGSPSAALRDWAREQIQALHTKGRPTAP